jgi:hypothetical protein
MSARKIALVIGYGQSNEQGHAAKWGDALTTSNPIMKVPVFRQNAAKASDPTFQAGMYEALAELIAKRKGHSVVVSNLAVGGSNSIGLDNKSGNPDWTFYTGSQGTGTVLLSGQGGYDPNGYIAAVQASVTAYVAKGYEVWSIMAGNDSNVMSNPVGDTGIWSAAKIAASLVNIMGLLDAAGARWLFWATSSVMYTARNPWAAGTGFYALLAAQLANNNQPVGMKDNAKFLAGADLTQLTSGGTGLTIDNAGFVGTGADNVHRNGMGCRICSELWYERLASIGVI